MAEGGFEMDDFNPVDYEYDDYYPDEDETDLGGGSSRCGAPTRRGEPTERDQYCKN